MSGLILLPGTCSKCGCTDAEACEGGCCWVDAEHTLCSACADPDEQLDEFDESEPGIGWDSP
jgi:hypothetical protein